MVRNVVVSLRPHQWTKNLLLFAAPALSKHLFEPRTAALSLLAFGLFCGLSGSVYLLNDVADLEKDRLHPTKCQRPIASGALAPATAVWIAAALGLICLGGAWWIGPAFLACAGGYLGLNLAYSFRLKHVVIVDVLALSLGFVLRAISGAVAVGVIFSSWLLVCTLLLALFLALAKRRHEIVTLNDEASRHRQILAEYSPYLLDQMIGVVTASCVTAYLVYTMADETVAKYGTKSLALTTPFVLYGIFRYLYLVHQKEQGGSPTDVLLTDKPLLLDVALWAVLIVVIVYLAPGAPMPIGR